MHRLAATQETSQLVLEVNAERKGERIANPCPSDGCRDICLEEKRRERGGNHLDGKWHEGEKSSDRHACCEFLACGMPELIRKKTISKNPMNPCAADMFGAG
jgi:hypothetical protein